MPDLPFCIVIQKKESFQAGFFLTSDLSSDFAFRSFWRFRESYIILVGGLEHGFYFSIYWEILGIITPSDFYIFQRGRLNHQPVIY